MRFDLARRLVRAVCLLHSSGWLHKNIRAESVIFFPEHVSALQEDRYDIQVESDVSKPFLMGYIFSRPDDIILPATAPADGTEPAPAAPATERDSYGSRKRSRRSAAWRTVSKAGAPQTDELNISGFTLDYYQHPAKHADPQRLYCHAYDVYSLGVLLIEVGLWQQLKDYRDYGEDHYELRRRICQDYLDRLRWECGDTYANVVLACLRVESSNGEEEEASERELCARAVADLDGCRA